MRRWYRTLPISLKLMVPFASLGLGISIFYSTHVPAQLERQLLADLALRADGTAMMMGVNLGPVMEVEDRGLAKRLFDGAGVGKDLAFAVAFSRKDGVFHALNEDVARAHGAFEPAKLARDQGLAVEGGPRSTVTRWRRDGYMLARVPVIANGASLGSITLGYDLAASEARVRQSRRMALLVSCALFAGICLLSWGLASLMATKLRRIMTACEALAAGRLDEAEQGLRSLRGEAAATRDELDLTARAFSEMLSPLRRILIDVRRSAMFAESSSGALTREIRDLANSALEQSSAADQTSASMEEMAFSIMEVAENAETLTHRVGQVAASINQMGGSITQVAASAEALQGAVDETSGAIVRLATSISQVADSVGAANGASSRASVAAQGGSSAVESTIAGMGRIDQVMGEVVEGIQRLRHSSVEVGEILELIDEIANQTNLLALNAAIEATRAGDAGRGFAVVADEVRKLAVRSAQATQKIAQLIKGIQAEIAQASASTQQGDMAIREGLVLTKQSGQALDQIVAAVGEVGALLTQIAGATQEQTAEAGRITGAADHMNHLTRQVASATREQAENSARIIETVENMNRMTMMVSRAADEQRLGAQQVSQALDGVSREVRSTTHSTKRIAEATWQLQAHAKNLAETVAFYRDEEADDLPNEATRELTLTIPAALPSDKQPVRDA